jgi:hypothetical protein
MRDAEIAILVMLAGLALIVLIGFQAVLEQTRPRIIYVHAGGRDERERDTDTAA